MNENLEELKKVNVNHIDGVRIVMAYLIPILEDFEKRLKAIETELGIYTEEEIKKLKIGRTDWMKKINPFRMYCLKDIEKRIDIKGDKIRFF